ncbi:hypothetical protein HHK36_024160 [Tetracentron sinense]|uniref:glutamate decarboxylase n=1 Tax=Tetracentron sinense TaxID=13715 RepID=A0A835D4D8_TETSI|nr:hypothetical protein HHK36_024160 [Tetracentron sinense]
MMVAVICDDEGGGVVAAMVFIDDKYSSTASYLHNVKPYKGNQIISIADGAQLPISSDRIWQREKWLGRISQQQVRVVPSPPPPVITLEADPSTPKNWCVNMIAHLFNAKVQENETAVGVGTVGSSEAIMLAGLAFKRKWQNERKAKGKPYDKPNIVTGANVQEVKLREGYYVMDPVRAVEMVDENTICVVAILGSTLTGEFEDVKLLNKLLTEKNKETGWDTPIHVDAASGGFIAPFLYPDLEWDFRLPLVKSINVSGHKYGLVYAGSSQIIAQYYQFIRLGFEGYKHIMENCMENAKVLKQGIEKTGRFDVISKDVGVPLVAFSLKDGSNHTACEISESLRRFGWIIPAYTMPPDAHHITVLRVVIREDFSRSLAKRLVGHIEKVLKEMDILHASSKVDRVDETMGGEGDEHIVEKNARKSQDVITRFWRRLVDGKKTRGLLSLLFHGLFFGFPGVHICFTRL